MFIFFFLCSYYYILNISKVTANITSINYEYVRLLSKPLLSNNIQRNIPRKEWDALNDLYQSTRGDDWTWKSTYGRWNFSSTGLIL